MVGKWVLNGSMGSTQTTHDVDAEWVLNREYIRMHEVSREKNSQGAPAYEAIVFIGRNQKSGEYLCLWLDTTSGEGLSNGVIGRGKPAENSIPFIFKYPSGDGFRTTFIYDEKTQTWQWIMDNESGGKLEPFFRAKLTKQ